MINSPLCRSALAAAIAVLSLPAAAQDDAALSIALGAMHAPLAAMARLLWNRGAIGELKPRQETYMIKAALTWIKPASQLKTSCDPNCGFS